MARRRAARDAPRDAPLTWQDRLWERPHLVGLAAVLLLAAALRFWGLGRESLWWDEAYSVTWAKQGYAWILDLMVHRDYHPPEYYFLLHAWMQAFGSGDAEVRALSALAGVAGVAACYLLGRDMFRPGVGVLFALLVAVSQFHLYYSQEARSYALLFAAAVLSMHAYWRLFHAEGGRRWAFAYYVGAAVLVLYAHYTGVFVLAAQFLHHAAALAMGSGRPRLKIWLASQAAVAALYLPWALVLLQQAGRLQQGFWMKRLFDAGVADFTVGGTLALITGGGLLGVVAWVLAANGALPSPLGGVNRERNPDDTDAHHPYPAAKVLLLVAWLLCSLLLPYVQSLVSQPIYVSRIMIPVLAPFLLLAAVGTGRLRHPVVRFAAVGLAVALSLPGLAAYYGTEAKEPWRDAVAAVDAAAAPNATVLLSPASALNPWAIYSQRTDLRPVPWAGAADNGTAAAQEIWIVSRQDAPCGAPSPPVAAASQGRRQVFCQAYVPEGLPEFPLAANPLYVHRYAR